MSWKKQLKKEVDAATKNLDQRILQTETETQLVASSAGKNATFALGGKKLTIIAVAVATVLMITLILSFALIKQPLKLPSSFSIEINPKAAFVVDDKDVVTSVTALNKDADLILSDSKNVDLMVGKTADVAATAFVDLAVKYGFIKRTDDLAAVRFSSVEKNRFSSVVDNTRNYLLDKGFYAMVFEQKVTEEQFENLIGVEKSSEKTIEQTLKEIPTLFTKRNAEGKTPKELTNIYVENLNDALGLIGELKNKLSECGGVIAGVVGAMLETWEETINLLIGLYQYVDFDSLDDYIEKVLDNFVKESEILIEMAKSDYQEKFDKITAADNENFIKDKLGDLSFNDYWDVIN